MKMTGDALQTETEINALVEQCALLADKAEYDTQSLIFSENVELVIVEDGVQRIRLVGRKNLLEINEKQFSHYDVVYHLLGQRDYYREMPTHARGKIYCVLTLVECGGLRETYGLIYEDDYDKIDDNWYISMRRVRLVWSDKRD